MELIWNTFFFFFFYNCSPFNLICYVDYSYDFLFVLNITYITL